MFNPLQHAAEARHEAWRKIATLAINHRQALEGTPDTSEPDLTVTRSDGTVTVTYRNGLRRYTATLEPVDHTYTDQEREALEYVIQHELKPLHHP